MSTNVDEQVQQAILDLLGQLHDDAAGSSAGQRYEPIIPSTLLDYHLTRAGIKPGTLPTSSKHLLSLVTEKYMTDVITDALAYSRLKQASTSAGAGGSSVNKIGVEDLQAALADHGITIKRPPYHL